MDNIPEEEQERFAQLARLMQGEINHNTYQRALEIYDKITHPNSRLQAMDKYITKMQDKI